MQMLSLNQSEHLYTAGGGEKRGDIYFWWLLQYVLCKLLYFHCVSQS